MNGIAKTILVILGILLLIPVVGFIFRTLFGLLMGVVGLVLSVLAIPFSLAAGLIGLVIGLVALAVPLVILIAIAGLGVWVLTQVLGGRSKTRKEHTASDMETMRDIHRGLSKMEERLDSLETILTRD